MKVILLGPQRRPTVEHVVRSLDLAGPFAPVTAGWQERELDDGELSALLGGRAVNLSLYRRWLDVTERDPDYAAAARALDAILGELADSALFALRFRHNAARALLMPRGAQGRPQTRESRTEHDYLLRAVRRGFVGSFGPNGLRLHRR